MNEDSLRIFIVVDESPLQMELGDRLTHLGYIVCGIAAPGEAAIEQIAAAAPDLVLVNLDLAGKTNGIATATGVRGRCDPAMIFLTTDADDEQIRQAMRTEPYGYLMKPFDERELHATIRSAHASHRAIKTLREANAKLSQQILERTALLEAGEERFRQLLAQAGPTHAIVTHDDVTSVHQALDRITTEEHALASLAKASTVGVFRTDAAGKFIEVSQRWCEITGLQAEEALGDGWTRALQPADRARIVAEWTMAVRSRQLFHGEYRFLHASGRNVWVIGQAAEITNAAGDAAGYIGTLTDATRRKRVALTMQAISSDLIALDGMAYIEAAARKVAELTDAEIVFVTRLDPDSPGELQTIVLIENDVLRPNIRYAVAGTPCAGVIDGQSSIVTRDAKQLFPKDKYLVEKGVESYGGVPLVDSTGRTMGHIGFMRKRYVGGPETLQTILKLFAVAVAAVMMREQSQRQYRDLFEFAPDALILSDRNGDIVLANRRAETIFGWTKAELIGQSVDILIPQDVWDSHKDLRDNFLKTSSPRLGPAPVRPALMAQRKDGSIFPTEIDFAPVTTEAGVMIAAAVRDVSERKSLENQLVQATKMEALGKLTGGMAHDFNNYLGVIIGNLDLLREIQGNGPAAAKLIDAALNGAERSAELTRSLLSFARRQPLDPRAADLNRQIAEIGGLLSRTLGEDIEFRTVLAEDLWLAKVDKAQLDSCIVNLANNARDAMPLGGMLTVATKNVHLDEHYMKENLFADAGDFVLIEISDTGEGMDPAIAARVFEPFFTTKGPGHGTGLGLSMVYGFVKQSGGHIKLYSEPGHGTTVRIYLPRDMTGIMEKSSALAASGAIHKGTETILVVEDNEDVRSTTMAQLSSLGYHVIEATNGLDALAILEKGEQHVDLLFTDVVMPGALDGYALAVSTLERWPEIGVLLTSGFPGDTLRSNGKDISDLRLLSKPYRKDELAQKIRQALEASGGSRDVSTGYSER